MLGGKAACTSPQRWERSSMMSSRHIYREPKIIAEIGVNHEGSLDRAKRMIDLAAEAGADVCKFQTYSASKLASQKSSPAYWDTSKEPTSSQFELFSKLDSFGEKEYRKLALHCSQAGVEFMSTPFDMEAAEFLNEYVSTFKIASADLTNIPLIEKVKTFGKPVLVSTGAASLEEIDAAAKMFSGYSAGVTFLHCVLNYPTNLAHANLACIKTLQARLPKDFQIGYSDHVSPDSDGRMHSLEIAFFLGASIIEKHFTDEKSARGNDHYHAMDAKDLRRFKEWMRQTADALGSGVPDLTIQSAARENARRRIFYSSSLPAGHVIAQADLIPLRANEGIPVVHWNKVIGSRLVLPVNFGDPAFESHLEAI